MTKNQKHGEENNIEILKAVAQAWHGHSSSSKATIATSEFDAHRLYFNGKPTRFKLEAMSMTNKANTSWDFRQSLWDSYEIVSVSKKLETGLMMNDPFAALKRRKESKNSLRNLFNMQSSRRFSEEETS